MQITVERVKPTKNSLVITAGGKEYFAKKDSGLADGMTVDAELELSDYNGKSYTWIKKWKAMATAAPQAPAAGLPGVPSTTTSAPWWMPFVSNVTAHAIAAGIITAPNMIEAWATAARNAANKIDSDIPF